MVLRLGHRRARRSRATLTAATAAVFVAGFAALGAAPAGAVDLAQNDLDVQQVHNVGGRFGYSPFTCPADPAVSGCGAQKPAAGTFEIGFQLHDTNQSGFTLSGGDTITFTTPSRTVLSAAASDYQLSWGATTHTVPFQPVPVTSGCVDAGSSWDCGFASSSAPAPAVSVSSAGNQVTVTLPAGFQLARGDVSPAVLVVKGAQNPPAADYSEFNWTVAAGDGSGNVLYDPGFATNDLTIDFDGPYQPNSGLVASITRVQVSDATGVALKATLRDQYGNPVSGQQAHVEVVSGSATETNAPSNLPTTGPDGSITETFADTLAEPVTFQAVVISHFLLRQLAQVTFTPGPPDATHSQLTVAPTTVTADGSSTALVTVDLADQFGNPTIQPADPATGSPAQGDQVVFASQLSPAGAFTFIRGRTTPVNGSSCVTQVAPGGGCTNNAATITRSGASQRAAEAQFDVSDPTAEDVQFEIEDLTAGVILKTGQFAPTIHFVAAPPVAAKSAIAGPSQPIAADGSATGRITVTLADQNGNPVAGVQVALQQSSGGHATIAPAGASTGASGQAAFDVSDSRVESVSFTASYSGTVGGQAVSGTLPAPPAAGPTITFVAGGTSGSASTAIASPTSLLANGSATATVTVTLVDGQGNPASARRVTLTQPAGAHSTITPGGATTDSGGSATFTLTDTSVESVTYTARDTTTGVSVAQQPTVSFTATPSVGRTTVAASPSSVAADGAAAATVTVTLLDTTGLPIAGKQLCLTQATGATPSSGPCPAAGSGPSTATAGQIPNASSGCAVQAPAGTTDCRGHAVFAVTAGTPATVTYGVMDLTDFPSGPALGPHATVTFTPPASEAGLSSLSASPTVALAGNGGPDGASTVTVTLIGPGGGALAGHTVGLGSSSSTATVSPATAQTDAGGQAEFTVTDTSVESVTFAATDLTPIPAVKLDQHATVTFIPDEAAASTVTAAAANATADGGATPAGVDLVTVALDPSQPLAGHQVSLSQSPGAHSTVSAAQIADSVSGCASQAAAGTSDCNGDADFKVTDASAETVSYTAHDASAGVTLGAHATITFAAPAPVVTGLGPNEGPVAGGTSVTITGTTLSVGNQVPAVKFGARPATKVTCASSSSCTATSPAAAGAGGVQVVVTTGSGSSRPATVGADTFTYLAAAPTVTRISPTSGPATGGTTVTVTGVNFGTSGASAVLFGTTRVPPTTINAAGTQLTVIAPAETAGKIDVTVSTPAGTSAKTTADKYTYVGARR